MNRNRTLPDKMRRHAAQRTDASVLAIFLHLETLEKAILSGQGPVDFLDLRGVSIGAGLNAKFLYGPLHKSSKNGAQPTKTQVENRIKALNELIAMRKACGSNTREVDEVGRLKADVAYWKGRYERLARHTNLWFVRMREQQRALRDLQRSKG